MSKQEQSLDSVPGLRVGEIVRMRRESLAMTIKDVATSAELSVASLHALEHGRLSIQLDNFLKILRVLKLDITDVLPSKLRPESSLSEARFEVLLAEHARSNLEGLI